MQAKLNRQQVIGIALVLAVGALLATLILGTGRRLPGGDDHGHAGEESGAHADDHEAEGGPRKGPRGGKLFTQDGYGVELVIFERGTEPRFRIYTYRDGKPLDPTESQASVTLERLGRKPEVFAFAPEQDYLASDTVVAEPHSFEVTIDARHDGTAYRFGYAQVEARVAMSDEQVEASRVEVLTAGPARIRKLLQLIGEVRFDEDRTVHVVPRLAGIVRSVPVNAGDRVKKGQLLAVISSQAVADQRAELLAAQKRLALARATFEREKSLWEERISAEQDYQQARTALHEAEIAEQNARQKLASLGGQKDRGDLTRYELRSPIDGVVIEKHAALGEAVREDATVFVVSDLSTVWAEMTVYARDLNVVKVGQKATVRAAAFDSASSGTVFYVGALVGEQTRAAKARIVLPNPEGIWRPGLPVNVELVAGEVDVPVAVSQEALQTVRDWSVVFGRYGDAFEARPIEVGRSDGTLVEVVEGLSAGERYAARNSFLIKAELGKAGASHDH